MGGITYFLFDGQVATGFSLRSMHASIKTLDTIPFSVYLSLFALFINAKTNSEV